MGCQPTETAQKDSLALHSLLLLVLDTEKSHGRNKALDQLYDAFDDRMRTSDASWLDSVFRSAQARHNAKKPAQC